MLFDIETIQLIFNLNQFTVFPRMAGPKGGRVGSDKSGQMRTGGGGWLAKCGRPLGKKIIATIFVKLTQIIWQYVCR